MLNSVTPPSGLPAISPTRGESGKKHAPRLIADVVVETSGGRESLPPLVGEMAGRPEGGASIIFRKVYAP
jgi:hypothetical protein